MFYADVRALVAIVLFKAHHLDRTINSAILHVHIAIYVLGAAVVWCPHILTTLVCRLGACLRCVLRQLAACSGERHGHDRSTRLMPRNEHITRARLSTSISRSHTSVIQFSIKMIPKNILLPILCLAAHGTVLRRQFRI